MKSSVICRFLSIVCLMAFVFSITASNCKSNLKTEPSDSTTLRQVLYFELLQPIVFGKIGLAYSIKKKKAEYLLYANRVFGKGLLNETPFRGPERLASELIAKAPHPGFEVGAQIRFPFSWAWEKETLAKYIRVNPRTSTFYYGLWAEYAKKFEDKDYDRYDSAKMKEVAAGVLLGVSIPKNVLLFDLSFCFGLDKVSTELIDFANTPEVWSDTHTLFVYKLGFKIGLVR